MEQSEQLKVIALLATIGLGECIDPERYPLHYELVKELDCLSDKLEDTAIILDETLENNDTEILQIVINYIKGVTT